MDEIDRYINKAMPLMGLIMMLAMGPFVKKLVEEQETKELIDILGSPPSDDEREKYRSWKSEEETRRANEEKNNRLDKIKKAVFGDGNSN